MDVSCSHSGNVFFDKVLNEERDGPLDLCQNFADYRQYFEDFLIIRKKV